MMGNGLTYSRAAHAVRRIATALAVAAVMASCAPTPTPNDIPPLLLSLGDGGVIANSYSPAASVSDDGNWVAFNSQATNLIASDTNGTSDTFLRHVPTDSVIRVAEGVTEAPRISANGRYVSYRTTASVVGVYDRVAGTTSTWPAVGGWESAPVVTPDGSTAIGGVYFLFGHFGNGCVVRDLSSGVITECPNPDSDVVGLHAASANGRYVIYESIDVDGDGSHQLTKWDRTTGTTEVLSVDVTAWGAVEISNNGRYLTAPDYTGIDPTTALQHDLIAGTTQVLPGATPDAQTIPRAASADGRYVVLYSDATNLSPLDTNGATDAYLWDTITNTVTLMSPNADGTAATSGSASCGDGPGQITPGGRVCTLFAEPATAADTNGVADAYLISR